MSEQNTQESPQAQKPQDLMELEKVISEVHQFHRVTQRCMVPGVDAEVLANLLKFLEGTYKQLLTQYHAHPYVVEAMKVDAEQKEAEKLKRSEMTLIGKPNG